MFFILFFQIFNHIKPLDKRQNVFDGTLKFDNSNKNILPLVGDWKVAINKFFDNANEFNGKTAYVPSVWLKKEEFGYRSYLLLLTGLQKDKTIYMFVPFQGTAYKLFVNGKLQSMNGTVGKTRDSSIPNFHSDIISLTPQSSKISIIMQISNYFDRRGGFYQPILLGTKNKLETYLSKKLFVQITFCIFFITMAIVQILFFLIYRKKTNLLLFIIFFLTGVTSFFSTSTLLISYCCQKFPWRIYEKTHYLLGYAIPIFALKYILEFYPQIKFHNFSMLIIPNIIILCIILIFPSWIFTNLNFIFQIYELNIFSLIILLCIYALKKKYKNAKYLLIFFVVLFLIGISCVAYINGAIVFDSVLPLSFIDFFNINYFLYQIITLFSYILILIATIIITLVSLNSQIVTKEQIQQKHIENYNNLEEKINLFNFTKREKEILYLVLEGKTNNEIAKLLFISDNTVKTHLLHIYQKCNVRKKSLIIAKFLHD